MLTRRFQVVYFKVFHSFPFSIKVFYFSTYSQFQIVLGLFDRLVGISEDRETFWAHKAKRCPHSLTSFILLSDIHSNAPNPLLGLMLSDILTKTEIIHGFLTFHYDRPLGFYWKTTYLNFRILCRKINKS